MLPAVKKLPFEELFRHKTVNAAPKRAGEREKRRKKKDAKLYMGIIYSIKHMQSPSMLLCC
jgi:hypothetical protein